MIAERSRLVCLPRCRPYPSVPVITDAFWSSHMDAGCMYASLSSSSSTHCPRRHVSAETLSHALSCTQTILSSQLTNCSLLNQFYIDKSVSDDLISIATLRLYVSYRPSCIVSSQTITKRLYSTVCYRVFVMLWCSIMKTQAI